MKVWIVVEHWGDGDWYVTTSRHSIPDKVPGMVPWDRLYIDGGEWLLTTLAEAEELQKFAKEHCPGEIRIVEVDVDD